MILTNVKNFNLNQIADSGQCFRWKKTSMEDYRIIHRNHVVTISQLAKDAVIMDCSEEEYKEVWESYFDLKEDYEKVLLSIDPKDEYLTAAGNAAQGIRILRQDPWEAMASFIISQRNNIPRIKATIERISEKFGNPIPYRGRVVYTFPLPEVIANADKQELEATGAYYRAEYLIEAARNQKNLMDAIAVNDPQVAFNILTSYKGIGSKVANCICLYGMHYTGAFPRDTWISKIEQKHYSGAFPHWKYPGTAGIMQQYMFYYERLQQGKL